MAKPEKEKIKETVGKKPEIEIKTMGKDLARLRLLESEQEREKIVELQEQQKTRKKDSERIEQFQEQEQEKQEKRMRGIGLFRKKKKEKPVPAETRAEIRIETAKTILEESSLSPEALTSAVPLPEFEKPSTQPEKPSAPLSFHKPATGLPQDESQDNQDKFAPSLETKREPAPPMPPAIPAPLLSEIEKPQPSPFPSSELSFASKKGLEDQRNSLLKQRRDIVKAMSLTVSEENRVEQKVRLIEEEEIKPDLEDRQSIEKTRRYLEKQRNSIEERRWQQEKQSQEIEEKIKKIDSDLAKLDKPASPPASPKLQRGESQGGSVSAFNAQSPIQTSEISAPAPVQVPPSTPQKPKIPALILPPLNLPPPEGRGETKRGVGEEIGRGESFEKPLELPVQEKPLAPRLTPEQRLAQAKQRLASFKEQVEQTESGQIKKELEPKEIDKFKERLKQSVTPKEEAAKESPDSKEMFEGRVEIYRDMPAKQAKSKKVLTRIAFILAVLLGIGVLAGLIYWLFAYWFSPKRQAGSETTEPPVIVDVVEGQEEQEEEQEITAPAPLIPIENAMTLEISEDNELPAALTESLNKDLSQGQFSILDIKQEKKILNLNEFLRILEIQMPSEISEKLEPEFTLFVYSIAKSQTQTISPNRLGFIAKIKQEEQINGLMRNWEQNMETDTEKLFVTLGKNQSASTNIFSETKYKETSFRYISFPQIDFGICWAIINNHLIFTSSGETMIKTIDLINL